jgi:tellurite resistance protein TerC
MGDFWDWLRSPPVLILAGFHAFIIFMLALDLGVFRRKAQTVSTKEAAGWSIVWVCLAVTFAFVGVRNFWHWWDPQNPNEGPAKALEFVTGYLVEFSLSVDNLFVFLVIFRYFAVPDHLRHRVLFWGIVGAVLLRAGFILFGAALLHLFHGIIYVFAGILLWTAYRLARSTDAEIDPGKNPVLRLARRLLPVVNDYDSPTFWVRREGRWYATPLPLVLLVVETTDVVFAFDSIPAIFGITRDAFIVYTSNIFAILGLRSLYFLLAGFLGMFRYLKIGLSAVLGFVGLKMLTEEMLEPVLAGWGIGPTQKILFSLGVIVAILGVTIIVSILAGPKNPPEHAPKAATKIPPGAPATTPSVPAPLAASGTEEKDVECNQMPLPGTRMTENEELQAVVAKLGIGRYQRHVLLCTGPSCCTPEMGQAAWEALKKQLKETGLAEGPNACYRTKVGCLRICCQGPTLLVYPEGTWYHGMTPERIPRFVQEHLIAGKPIEEWIFARNPLPDRS